MRARNSWIVTITLICIFLAFLQATHVTGQSEHRIRIIPKRKWIHETQASLSGLQGVYVIIEDFDSKAEEYGFDRQVYKNDVELQLRQRGVKVFSDDEIDQVTGWPALFITVQPLISETMGIAAVNISAELKEKVMLLRNRTLITPATTWKRNTLLVIEPLNERNNIRNNVKNIVNQFINDYYEVNTKSKSKGQKVLSTIDSIPYTKVIWVLCRNDECKDEYQMGFMEYFKYMEANANPMVLTVPALTCKKCGELSAFRAEKCTNPTCRKVFFWGIVPNDFADRCPECGHSETEENRKRRKRTRGSK